MRAPVDNSGRARRFPLLASALVAVCLLRCPVAAAEAVVDTRIVYQSIDGMYVDAGTDRGLVVGASGTVLRDGAPVGTVEVVQVTKSSSLVRVLAAARPDDPPRPGDEVRFKVRLEGTAEPARRPPSDSVRRGDDEFVPLLTVPQRSVGLTEPGNIFHGRLWLRQLLQVDGAELRDYSVTRVGSSGSLERIAGSPWSLEWSGDLAYRAGQALEGTQDFEEPVLRVYRTALSRRFRDDSQLRFGRFLPTELPSVGYIDGAQGEKVLGSSWRLGAVGGLKPTRARLDVSVKEPTLVPYATAELGELGDWYYSGTAGLLASLYEGEPDRMAFLFDQRANLGRRVTLFSTSEVDFDIGGARQKTGASLTRWDLFGSYAAFSFLSLRAGLGHWERPDTQAERAALGLPADGSGDGDLFDDGYWRYWAGTSIALPLDLRLGGEISFTDSRTESFDPRWTASLTRVGLPLLPTSSITLTAYNILGSAAEGYGGRLSAWLPIIEGSLDLQPSVAFQLIESDLGGNEFGFTDLALRLNWLVTDSWTVTAGVSHAFGADVERYFIDFGVTFRW